MKKLLILPILAVLAAGCSLCRNDKVNLIFETDMGNDVDDAIGLGIIHRYINDGEVNLMAVCLNKGGLAPLQYVDAVNTWYGHPGIPIGRIEDAPQPDDDNCYARVANMTGADGKPVFRKSVKDYSALPEAVALYRELLAKAKDNSVTIASVGFSTNLARLLDSAPDSYSDLDGKALVARKVKLLVCMACCFNGSCKNGEYNVKIDSLSARKLFAEWPGEIVISPSELGTKVRYPATSIENDFGWADAHPVVEAYKAYRKMPYDRPCWDPTAIIYAVEGGKWFGISETGSVRIEEGNESVFTPSAEGNARYLSVDDQQSVALVDYMVEMLSTTK